MLNIMFTLILGLLTITCFEKINNVVYSIFAICGIIYLGKILQVDYSWFGVTTIFLMYIFRKNKIALTFSFATLAFLYYYERGMWQSSFIETWYSYVVTILSLVCIYMYNGKLGRKIQYFFYWFYPVHMLLIYIIYHVQASLLV